MIWGVLAAARRVYSHYTSWVGAGSTFMGVLNEVLGQQIFLPTTAWWVIAIGATAATAVQIQWELDQERDQTRKPEPTVSLAKLVERIVGTNDMAQQGVPQKTSDALVAIREKARLGSLSVWGRQNANQSHLDFYPLEPIDPTYWSNAQIDYLDYLQAKTCATKSLSYSAVTRLYSDLHFDEKQVEKLWRKK